MASEQQIKLVRLGESERNTVFYAWDAIDTEGREYYITHRRGILTISGPQGLIVERDQGAPDESASSPEEILRLAHDVFDGALIENGGKCACGCAFDYFEIPLRCVGCGEFLRILRADSLNPEAVNLVPAELAAITGPPLAAWQGKDEEGHPVWVLWSARMLTLAETRDPGAESEGPAVIYREEIPFPEGAPPQEIIAEVANLMEMDIDLACLTCVHCGAVRTGTAKACHQCGGKPLRIPRDSILGLPAWHCVRVQWYNGSREVFRYDTFAQAMRGAEYQYLENQAQCRWAEYIGRRINWGALFGIR